MTKQRKTAAYYAGQGIALVIIGCLAAIFIAAAIAATRYIFSFVVGGC